MVPVETFGLYIVPSSEAAAEDPWRERNWVAAKDVWADLLGQVGLPWGDIHTAGALGITEAPNRRRPPNPALVAWAALVVSLAVASIGIAWWPALQWLLVPIIYLCGVRQRRSWTVPGAGALVAFGTGACGVALGWPLLPVWSGVLLLASAWLVALAVPVRWDWSAYPKFLVLAGTASAVTLIWLAPLPALAVAVVALVIEWSSGIRRLALILLGGVGGAAWLASLAALGVVLGVAAATLAPSSGLNPAGGSSWWIFITAVAGGTVAQVLLLPLGRLRLLVAAALPGLAIVVSGLVLVAVAEQGAELLALAAVALLISAAIQFSST